MSYPLCSSIVAAVVCCLSLICGQFAALGVNGGALDPIELGHTGGPPALVMVVTPNNLGVWRQSNASCSDAPTTGTQQFVSGPETPPAGNGSLEMSTGFNGNSFLTIGTDVYDGQRLSQLSNLTYCTFNFNNSNQAIYIILGIDSNNDGTQDDLLFFEPVYQSGNAPNVPDQGSIVPGAWQCWNASGGGWWSRGGKAGLTPGDGVKTLDVYTAAFPNATLASSPNSTGAIRLAAGCGEPDWANLTGNTDAVLIAFSGPGILYDFEPSNENTEPPPVVPPPEPPEPPQPPPVLPPGEESPFCPPLPCRTDADCPICNDACGQEVCCRCFGGTCGYGGDLCDLEAGEVCDRTTRQCVKPPECEDEPSCDSNLDCSPCQVSDEPGELFCTQCQCGHCIAVESCVEPGSGTTCNVASGACECAGIAQCSFTPFARARPGALGCKSGQCDGGCQDDMRITTRIR